MPPPTNTTAATATAIASLPASVTQTVHDAGTTYTVWYRYTAVAGDVWIGVWAFGDLVTYRPTITAWLEPTGAPVAYLALEAENVPIQFPVTTSTTYYFQIAPNSGNPTPAVLTLSLERGPQYDVAEGSIAVPDDTEGFPLVFLDSATGAVLRAVYPFPAGEAGDTLNSGIVAMSDLANNQIAIYSAALTLVGAPLSVPGNLAGTIRAHPSGPFYVADDAANTIRTITAAAALGSTWGPMLGGGSSLRALAVNQAETLVYYADHPAQLVKTWNLTTNTAGATFDSFPAGYTPQDLIVLADDTVLVDYGIATGLSVGSDGETIVRHLTPAATTLQTFTYTGLATPDGTLSRLARAIEDPYQFWIWTHHLGGVSRFRKIRIHDSAELVSIEVPEFEVGAAQADPTADPDRFGISFSCPFWIVRVELPGTGPPPTNGNGNGGGGNGGTTDPPYVAPSYHLDARYIRRLRRAPHVANENLRVFYRRFELDLERGQGLATGQGSDPMVLLRISRDGGQTWGEEQRMSAGALGAYTQRVLARRLGHARDTVFEVTVSDPIAWSLVGAWLDLEPGTN